MGGRFGVDAEEVLADEIPAGDFTVDAALRNGAGPPGVETDPVFND